MRILKGKKIIKITQDEFEKLCMSFQKIYLDIGTGDGKFVYKNAKEYKNILWIGLDPNQKQMEISSRKVNRERLTNCIFILGSVEFLPDELQNKINKIFINYPWGSLLQQVILPSREYVNNLKNLLTDTGELEVIVGYSLSSEPTQTQKLSLPELNEEFIQKNIIPNYEQDGFILTELSSNIPEGSSTWAKKLFFGRPRIFYKLRFEKGTL